MSNLRSGMDLGLGDRCSHIAFTRAKETFANRAGRPGSPILQVGASFANCMDYGAVKVAMTSDGIGSKIEVAERTGVYRTLGFDLVAMVVDDLVSNGFEPANLSNILDVDYLDVRVVDELMQGLADAAAAAQVAVTGGEIAELGARVRGYGPGMHFNWCATAIGLLPQGLRPVDGLALEPGDVLVALPSTGFRSNGFSLVRSVLGRCLGDAWHEQPLAGFDTWGMAALTPSIIYAPAVLGVLRSGVDVHGIAHITGGGIPDKLGRVLRVRGLGAVLDDLPPAPWFMAELQRMGGIDDRQAWHLWNMGTGMIVAVGRRDAERCAEILRREGHEARVAGRVVPERGISILGGGSREVRFDLRG
ncbi:MAG: phosphoribosylformylglycinamidine cyclo-ligase [Deltaproteobacteria bacterium]|nr:phosphoribosylformylglycinamidine cyclo-ligase [Deltaproteobacteria bacterium]